MLPEPDDRDDSAKGNALACIARALRDLETVAEAPRRSWPCGLRVLVDTTCCHVRLWHKADVQTALMNVRFEGEERT